MLVRLTKCTVKGHSAPKMKKNGQDDKYGSYMCAKGTQNLFFCLCLIIFQSGSHLEPWRNHQTWQKFGLENENWKFDFGYTCSIITK